MTLDTLTRAQAEVSHVRFQNSLVQASQAFRERFQGEQDLFRTIHEAHATTAGSQSTPSVHETPAKKFVRSSAPVVSAVTPPHEEDILRLARLSQCCKRVRVWRRQVTNPLLLFKQQQLGGGKAGGSNGGMGGPKKTDRRMHVTLFMAMIVDIYEQRIFSELEGTAVAEGDAESCFSGGGGIQESFPEFVVRFVSQRTSNRRIAVDQLHSTVATALYAASIHARVRLFGSLCGLDDKFNPPEKIKVFLHLLESLHRCKVAASFGPAGASSVRVEEATASAPLADVVFHNVGVTQNVAQKVISDLFRDDFYWNFRFWLAPCTELNVDCAWPRGVCEELQERAFTLAAASRNTLLNALRKIDGDALLELLVDAWTTRAKQLQLQLDQATDREESVGVELLRTRQATQSARMQRRPATDEERQLFEQLVDEHWNAPVSWTSAKMLARVAALVPARPLAHLQQLYAAFITELPPTRRPWEWNQWTWETEWEWGELVLAPDELEQ
ncbi:hypothetical protein BBJ28_00008959 [Nothophytophthora sp. Chile5]|nr:hypothetical protein BBJ28_00008959 [Nothophytophthora sp. Chile5]